MTEHIDISDGRLCGLLRDLREHHDRQTSIAMELISFKADRETAKVEVDGLAGGIEFEVREAKDPETGKLKFSNEKQREGEANRRKNESKEYFDALWAYRELQKKVSAGEEERWIAKREYEMARYQIDTINTHKRFLTDPELRREHYEREHSLTAPHSG